MPETILDRVDIFGPRLADLAFERAHQRGGLAAHEGAGPPRDLDVEAVAAAQDILAQEPPVPGLLDRLPRVLDRQRVLLANIDVALIGAHRVAADQHSLQDRVRIAFEDTAVHIGAGIALIGVADHELLVAAGGAALLPLAAGGEPPAAPAAQTRSLDLVDNRFRRHAAEHLRRGGIAADGDVVPDVGRVDLPVLAQEYAVLRPVEGNLRFLGDLLPGNRVRIEQAFNHFPGANRLIDNLRHVLRRDMAVQDIGRVDDHDRPLLAEAVTAGQPQLDRVGRSLRGQRGLQRFGHAGAVGRLAPGATAHRHDRGLRSPRLSGATGGGKIGNSLELSTHGPPPSRRRRPTPTAHAVCSGSSWDGTGHPERPPGRGHRRRDSSPAPG